MEDKIEEIQNKLVENALSIRISRVPLEVKREFISLANAQFVGDYGLLLKWIWDEAMEYQVMKSLFFDKLQNMEDKLDSLLNKQEEKIPKKVIKTLGGREMKGGINKNE